jgi:hypothetical protein
VQQVNHQIVYGKTYKRETEESEILHHYIRVVAAKCPGAVEYVVRCGCADESQRVGYIFVELEKLLRQICNAKIYHNSRAANNAELQESLNESLVM